MEKIEGNIETLRHLLQKKPELRDQEDINIILPYVRSINIMNEPSMKEEYEESDMTENILEAIAQRMGVRVCKKGETVFHYGDKGDLFYFILKGEV